MVGMVWIIYAFLSALSFSLRDVLSKKSVKYVDEYVILFCMAFFALPIMLPFLLLSPPSSLTLSFWIVLLIHGVLNNLALILFLKAIKNTDLSLTAPLLAFTPIFVLLTSFFTVHEYPKPAGLAGILLIMGGSYALNIQERRKGILAPFKALFTNTGTKYMLIVSILWGLSSNLDKIGIHNSSALTWSFASTVMTIIVLLPLLSYKLVKQKIVWKEKKWVLVGIGVLNAFVVLFHMKALDYALVAYVLSIKRTSAIFSSIFGYMIFKEPGIKQRLLGAIMMVGGVVLIALS